MEQNQHGGEIYDKKISWDFSVNTNPFGLPEGVKKTLIRHIDTFALYPDNRCGSLASAIADYERADRDYIICGNGASDLIFRLCYALKPGKAMVTAPAFSEYEKALREAGSQIEYCLLTERDSFQVTEQLLNQLNETIDLLFLCNPNNPVGNLIPPALLEKIMTQCLRYNIFLVMDECFIEFTDEPEAYSIKKYLNKNDRVFLLRAFTKLYAMAGLRLGYGICSDIQLINKMSAMGPAWNVSVPAQIAGIEALKEESYRLKTKELIRVEREYLYNSLKTLGIKVFKPTANYIFFKCWDTLYEFLLHREILIRQCGNYNQLSREFYRIAVKNHEENVILIREIAEFLDICKLNQN
ncbi:pyridoxal phosphate-dependent aminotransferase [Anaerocolumna sp. MB42-C2]|uniref:pyridoxal phosphate-dependent aminotransferase n=1 Tax=Anaerocolumna sp. MB42-C2 TaxID=3070997 RepID=UPI0027DF4BDD|nr:aminotransferase class I/II-fold pyridoxal phosphate-dependent enzyme [Anaerocolumna sp. MB42-C2]WMJ89522.1 aminotransferase class I/II-fold pyridoxal phosphate-dependent enzyme [Anaerocolumna sp. MB42-C2]